MIGRHFPSPFLPRLGFFLSGILWIMMLSGCGFHPLYGKEAGGDTDVSAELGQIFVANIPTRFGQTMRLALQQEMGGAGSEMADKYVLRANGSLSYEAVDIHQDNTSGRTRIVGWANWELYSVEQTPKLLAQGYARALDGYDPTINQYFAQSLNNEEAQAHISQHLARDITQQVAIWFRSRQAIGPDTRIRPKKYLDLDAMPTDRGAAKQRFDVDGFPSYATGRLPAGTSTTTGASDDVLGSGETGDAKNYEDGEY